jgi:hypothetical protein
MQCIDNPTTPGLILTAATAVPPVTKYLIYANATRAQINLASLSTLGQTSRDWQYSTYDLLGRLTLLMLDQLTDYYAVFADNMQVLKQSNGPSPAPTIDRAAVQYCQPESGQAIVMFVAQFGSDIKIIHFVDGVHSEVAKVSAVGLTTNSLAIDPQTCNVFMSVVSYNTPACPACTTTSVPDASNELEYLIHMVYQPDGKYTMTSIATNDASPKLIVTHAAYHPIDPVLYLAIHTSRDSVKIMEQDFTVDTTALPSSTSAILVVKVNYQTSSVSLVRTGTFGVPNNSPVAVTVSAFTLKALVFATAVSAISWKESTCDRLTASNTLWATAIEDVTPLPNCTSMFGTSKPPSTRWNHCGH